jgi:hypothetical protein
MTTIPRSAEPVTSDVLGDEDLRQRVVLYLSLCRPELQGIVVSAKDGTVTLMGEVPTYYLRQLSIERTRHVAGVRQLIDLIEVPAGLDGFRRHAK